MDWLILGSADFDNIIYWTCMVWDVDVRLIKTPNLHRWLNNSVFSTYFPCESSGERIHMNLLLELIVIMVQNTVSLRQKLVKFHQPATYFCAHGTLQGNCCPCSQSVTLPLLPTAYIPSHSTESIHLVSVSVWVFASLLLPRWSYWDYMYTSLQNQGKGYLHTGVFVGSF